MADVVVLSGGEREREKERRVEFLFHSWELQINEE
jgi:hypothetical protein